MRHADTGRRPIGFIAVAVLAAAFGVATIVSGGRVIFGTQADRAAAGDYVPFVVWFNFLAGFAYVAAAAGIALARRWAAHLSVGIAAATAVAGLAFWAHVLAGGPFESRTVAALAFRELVWVGIAVFVLRSR